MPDPEYQIARKRYFVKLASEQNRWDARCEVCGNRVATDIHHRKGRDGDLITDSRFFLGVCRRCHNKIGAQPEWAKRQGYSVDRVP